MEKEQIAASFRKLQEAICTSLEELDGSGRFTKDHWSREGGGGGLTRVIADGDLIEKGGVNFSEVFGTPPDYLRKVMGKQGNDENYFFASGVSIVLHPKNPMVPIIHMNVRYFESGSSYSWFGGGIDVSPHYIFDEDAQFFHRALRQTCDRFDPAYYPRFKTWADDYFYITHRKETRGIGGIFFDHLEPGIEKSKEDFFQFVMAVGNTFIPVYSELANRNRHKTWGETEKQWQAIRRGRYVEFNLVYDRGTKFGLESDGRTESILMSLPPQAEWKYEFAPPKGSREDQTLQKLNKGIDWANEGGPG